MTPSSTSNSGSASARSGLKSGGLIPSQAELVRANRMDEQWVGRMADHLDSLALVLLGGQRYSAWRSGLYALGRAASKALYYGTTTGQCLQTLGEEYASIIQVDRTRKRIPGSRIRLALTLVQCLFPDLLIWLLGRIERRVRSDPELSEPLRRRRLAFLGRLNSLVTAVYELNSALFYINGSYYQLSKRLLGVRHLRARPGLGHVTEALYKLIGWLSLARLSCRALTQLRAAAVAASSSCPSSSSTDGVDALSDEALVASDAGGSRIEEEERQLLRNCPLCCERVKEASAVVACGHVFCWSCIVRCLQLTGRCPMCRVASQPQRVVHLADYSDAPV